MADKKNALAELAERLKNGIYSNSKDRFASPVVSESLNANDVIMAQRIVAELAKIEDVTEVHNLKPVQVPNIWQCYDAVVKCRALAEEGKLK